jgi:four helix bundle protein
MRNFRELRVWRDSIDFAALVYQITKYFPAVEQFGLTRQVRRSVVSISSNIAEGCSRSSDKDFCHFLEIALGSAYEAETQLIIANRTELLDTDKLDECVESLQRLQRQLTALINKTRIKG